MLVVKLNKFSKFWERKGSGVLFASGNKENPKYCGIVWKSLKRITLRYTEPAN